MSMFANLNDNGLEKTEDRLGGGSFLKETDIYTGKVKVAYAGESDGGAMNITLVMDLDGKEYRETIYITNKKKENFFVKDGVKVPLPGYTLINDLCLATVELPLAELSTEEKVVKIYDFDEKKEVPKSVPVLVDLIGKTVSLGIIKILENKGVKQSDGTYADGPEEREINQIEKVFHTESRYTLVEAREGAGDELFWDKWLTKNKGQVRDKRTIKDGQGGKVAGGAPKAGGSAPAGGAPKKSLFGNK